MSGNFLIKWVNISSSWSNVFGAISKDSAQERCNFNTESINYVFQRNWYQARIFCISKPRLRDLTNTRIPPATFTALKTQVITTVWKLLILEAQTSWTSDEHFSAALAQLMEAGCVLRTHFMRCVLFVAHALHSHVI